MPHHRAPKRSRNQRKAESHVTSHQAEMDRNDAIQAKMDRREIEDSSDGSDGNIASKGRQAIERQVQEAILDITTDQNPAGFTLGYNEQYLTLGDHTSLERGPTAVVDFWMTCPLELLRNNIMKFASLNPEDHFNQVATTNRRNDNVWRHLVMGSEYLRRLDRRMILTHYIYDIIPRMNDELDCDVPVYPLLHDLLPLL